MPLKKLPLLFVSILLALTAASQSSIDSLLRICEQASEKQKPGYYLEISFNTRTDSAKSNSFARKAYQLAVKNNQIKEQAKAFYYTGETYYYSLDYRRAIPRYEKAIPLFKVLKDTLGVFDCYNSIGLCYYYMNQGEKAIAQFIEALKLCENDLENGADVISNIGMVHEKIGNYQEAILNYRKALKINISINDSASIGVGYNGLGEVFSTMNRSDSAIANFSKALHIYKKLKNKGRLAIELNNLALIYKDYPDSLDKALSYFNEAWIGFKESGWQQFETDIKYGIGSVYLKQSKYKEAIKMFEESLLLTDKYLRGLLLKKLNYEGLSEVNKKMGDYKSALKYNILYAQYSDSLLQKDKYERLMNLEKQYETEKKENEIIQLLAKQELTDIQLRKNKQLKLLGFVTALLLLLFVFFVSKKYLDKIKLNQILEEKNLQIEQSEQELRLLNAAKNKFFSIIAHDLKNPFHTVMGYSYLLSKDYDRFTEEERRKFAGDINHSTNNIFRLLQNLLEWSKAQTGRLKYTPIEVEFRRILENSLSVLRSLAEQKKIQLNFSCNDDLVVFADPQMIETVLRNLINNAIKFTPEKGLIEIAAEQIENRVRICVRDSGVGISEEDMQNLFRIDSKVKRKGTNDEDGSGLGLILCKEFVDKNSGMLWVESMPGKGSCFSFTIPAKVSANAHVMA